MSYYIRSTDDAEMIEMGPHQYVNSAVLARLGYRENEKRPRPKAVEERTT